MVRRPPPRTITTIRQALAALGVTDQTLTADEKRALDDHGYVILYDMMSSDWLQELRREYEDLMYAKYGEWHTLVERGQAGLKTDFWFHEQGTRRLTNLVSEAKSFDGIYTHPRLLAAMFHILQGEFHLEALNAREALPGQGAQVLHADKPRESRTQVDRYVGANSGWLLDDFTPDNGSTRVIPGTHQRLEVPYEMLPDPAAPHPDEVLVVAPAGSVVVFNNHLWHGGTTNRTSRMRRVIHCSFVERTRAQNPPQRESIHKAVYERISPAARYILNV
jgi:ectoine hydroxylase-related dioxygenase (phytanoyl-CoA dioxygenase family)